MSTTLHSGLLLGLAEAYPGESTARRTRTRTRSRGRRHTGRRRGHGRRGRH